MLKVYPAIFHEEESFWVEFPDLKGCNTCGKTIEETMELAQEALGLYLVSLIEDKQEVPKPSTIDSIKSMTSDLVNYVSTDIDKYRKNNKAIKKTLSIPAWLAEEAEQNHISLSKVLQEGLKERLGM